MLLVWCLVLNILYFMAEVSKSYFERLRFDPKLLDSVVARYITNMRIVILLIIAVIVAGIVSYTQLPKRLNPEIQIPIINVVTVLPGASPADVESLVTEPLENEIRSLTGIDTIQSVSQDNVSVITTQFLSTVDGNKAKEDVQSAVDSVSTLPTDAQTPSVTLLDFEDQPVLTFALSSNNSDLPGVMQVARDLKVKLEELSAVDRVTLNGYEETEIAVIVDPVRVSNWGINPMMLSGAVRSSIASYPAGSVSTGNNSFSLTIDPLVSDINGLRNMQLNVAGTVLRLGDIATVIERPKSDNRPSYLTDAGGEARRVVVIDVYKAASSNIDQAATAAEDEVQAVMEQYGNRFSITTIVNYGEEINDQFIDLLGEFRSTILLVFATLLIFLGLRQAVISSFTVPLTFLSAFMFMNITGMSINFLSLFSFLLALGLLIDDTIVVVSAMTTYYRTGKFSPTQTGLLVWKDTIVPIWSTTITTIWSFVPLLLTTGIIGEFIKPIPIVVTVTMISSTAIAVLITLPIMMVILKPEVPRRVVVFAKLVVLILSLIVIASLLTYNPFMPVIAIVYLILAFVFMRVRKTLASRATETAVNISGSQERFTKIRHGIVHGFLNIEWLSTRYYRLISRILASQRARRITLITIVAYSIIGFLLLPLGLVKNEFFPKVEGEQVYMNLEAPSGTSQDVIEKEALLVLEDVKNTPGITHVYMQVGATLSGFGGRSNAPGALFTFTLPDIHDQERTSIEIAEELRGYVKKYGGSKLSIIEASGGPPAGADLQITLSGEDLSILEQYADRIKGYLEEQQGVTNAAKSINPGTSAVVFLPNTDRIAREGLSPDSIGLWLRTYASGFTLSQVNFDKTTSEKEDIVFKFSGDDPTPEGIAGISIPTQRGNIPVLALGRLETKTNPTQITREDGKRTIAVTAGVIAGQSVSDKNKELENFADSLRLPEGYSWKTGGVNEENQKSVNSIILAMGVSALLILVTMVLQFGSYRQAAIVLIVIPLAVSSVFYSFGLTGTPLSFPALIGVLSLFGIVVTNSMFIVDKININKREGMPFKDAIADAGASRMEPIILTKLSTVLGLLPITLADPLWRGLGGAIISGLLIASTIMLLFIPVIYYDWMKPAEETT